jgi:hypothetical protein
LMFVRSDEDSFVSIYDKVKSATLKYD